MSVVKTVIDKIFDNSDSNTGPNTGPPSQGFTDGDSYTDRGSKDNVEGSATVAAGADAGSVAGDKLAEITRDELKNYLEKFGETEEFLAGDTNSRAMIDSAKESQSLGQQVSAGMQQRSLGRYGANMTPAQMAASQRIGSLGNASSYTGAVNNSVLDQRDRNQNLKMSLLGLGNAQMSTAMSGLGSAAGMEAGREAEYQRARASAHAANMQIVGQIIGLGA
jgi:hypothetical protein